MFRRRKIKNRQDELLEFASRLLYLESEYNVRMIGSGRKALVKDLESDKIYDYKKQLE